MSERKLTPNEVRIFYVRWHSILGKVQINNSPHPLLRRESPAGDLYSIDGTAMEAYYSLIDMKPVKRQIDLYNEPGITVYEYDNLKYSAPVYVNKLMNKVKDRDHDFAYVKDMIEKHCENNSIMSIPMCKPRNPAAFWRDLIKRYLMVYSKLPEKDDDVPFTVNVNYSYYNRYQTKQKIGDQTAVFMEI